LSAYSSEKSVQNPDSVVTELCLSGEILLPAPQLHLHSRESNITHECMHSKEFAVTENPYTETKSSVHHTEPETHYPMNV
jgi:hypothetical protein